MDVGQILALLVVVAILAYAVSRVVKGNRKKRSVVVVPKDDSGRGHW